MVDNRRQSPRWVGPTAVGLAAALLAVLLFSTGQDAGPPLPRSSEVAPEAPSATPVVAPAPPPPEVPPATSAPTQTTDPKPVAPVHPPSALVRPAGALVKHQPRPVGMSCDDLLNLYESDVPAFVVTQILGQGDGAIPDDGCLVEAGADDAFLDALDELR